MRYIQNGKPIIHKHVCDPARVGFKISASELQELAVNALIEEYKLANYRKVVRHAPEFNTGADFSFEYAEMTICGKVVYAQDYNVDINTIDTTALYSYYRRGRIMPRLYLASAYCVSSPDGSMLCGGDYIFKFHAESLMYDEVNPDLERKLDHIELVQEYLKLWETGDTSIILRLFDKRFRSYPTSGFDPLVARKEYLNFFKTKTEFANESEFFTMALAKDTDTGEIGIAVNNRNALNFISVTTKDGRILQSWTQRFRDSIRLYDPGKELYQSHADHIGALMPPDKFLGEVLPEVINRSEIYHELCVDGCDLLSLRYVNGGNDFISLLKENKEDGQMEFICGYPYLTGAPLRVAVKSVLPWDNGLEATVLCESGDFSFAFFATDYYVNSNLYVKGANLNIQVSALGINVKAGMEGFTFEGQKAVDFLSKMGQTPKYDDKGELIPVRVSTKELVAFFNNDERCPDEAEFQSPMSNIQLGSLIGVKMYEANIQIHHDPEISIPIYFPYSQLPAPREGQPLCGWMWLTGRIVKN